LVVKPGRIMVVWINRFQDRWLDQFRTVMQEISARFSVRHYRFGLIALKAGETGAVQLPVVFGDDRFGERIGLAEAGRLALLARRLDALLSFAFALQRADLE